MQWLVFCFRNLFVKKCRVLSQNSDGRKGMRDEHTLEWMAKSMRIKGQWKYEFKCLSHFNLSLLTKQGWRLINYSDLLLTRTLKAKYYPNSDFLKAELENIPFLYMKECMGHQRYTFKSIVLKSWYRNKNSY